MASVDERATGKAYWRSLDDLADGPELGALAAGYVLVTAIVGPVATRYADRIPIGRLAPPSVR